MNELALFAGAGGGILGGHLLGWRTVCAVEVEPYPASVLLSRQNDGTLPPFPIWDDVRTFDGRPWRGIVDVVSGGFPCQDISSAGQGRGITGSKSGLWKEMARIIGEVRPRYALIENSPMLTHRGLGTVLSDLAALGFDAEWGVLSARDVGAPHLRERIWIVAHSNKDSARNTQRTRDEERTNRPLFGQLLQQESPADHDPNPTEERREERVVNAAEPSAIPGGRLIEAQRWFEVEPNLGRVAYGVADRVDRLSALGNGQVPAVAAWYSRKLRGRAQAVVFFTELAPSGDPQENFKSLWTWGSKLLSFGRLSTFSYLEYLRIMGLPVECDSLFLDDRAGSRSHRNGLCKVLGRDDLDWHESNPSFDGRYPPPLLAWLEEEGALLLAEAADRLVLRPYGKDVGYFTLESALCTFKSWFRPNRRYPNVYNDLLHDRIKVAERNWPAEDVEIFWRAREATQPAHLLLEKSPLDPGCVPEKQNHFRETGEVIMMHRAWPHAFGNAFNARTDPE